MLASMIVLYIKKIVFSDTI